MAEADGGKALAEELVRRAQEGEHAEFSFLHDRYELRAAKACMRANAGVAAGFARSLDAAADAYISEIRGDSDGVSEAISLAGIAKCAEFYEGEADVLRDMIDEYRCYVRWGHRLTHIFGMRRPEEDEIDWRTLKAGL